MPIISETVHHASDTYVKGTELPADHPLFVAAPHLFEPYEAPAEEQPAKRGPGRPRKDA